MEKYGQLFESVFKRKLTDESTAGYLKNITKEHPYFSIAQFYLLSLSQKDVNGYKAQAKKTTVLFNNNHWLNFQLLEAGYNDQPVPVETPVTEEQPVLNNTYDKVFSAENLEESAEQIIEEEEQSIEPIEEKTEIAEQEITTEQPVEEIVAAIEQPVFEEPVAAIEEVQQPMEEPFGDQFEEINISIVEEPAAAVEETQQTIEETFVETIETPVIETVEEINTPVIEEQVAAIEETQQITEEPFVEPVEEINTHAAEETVATIEEIQQPAEEPFVEPIEEINIPAVNKTVTATEEISTVIVEENEPLNEKIAEPIAAIAEVKAEPVNEPLLFEPLHTTDYFASVGIKLSEEEKTSGSLGKQLKSFTEWLKSMKKVHAAQLVQTTNAAQVEASNTENSIQNLAEKSNEENDVITEAMADVLMQQGRQGKAVEILEKLSLLNPGKSTYFAAKINQIKEK